MNRLILIGNGFDLAHGLKTRFSDFINDYLANAINEFISTRKYQDDLFNIGLSSGNEARKINIRKIGKDKGVEVFRTIESTSGGKIQITFHHDVPLLNQLMIDIENQNWVDIEVRFFEELVKAKNDIAYTERVNSQFKFLKEKLIEYLKEESKKIKTNHNAMPMVDCMTEPIFTHDMSTKHLTKHEKPENLYFLNFNYTPSVEQYEIFCQHRIPKTNLNYIHGNLEGNKGLPIFGFGDEFDKDYLTFEELKNNELFEHIKSFWYLKNKNYFDLLRYIESDSFQVHIYGHSCGLSDRTMLRTIFEHKNCFSIKVFYYGTKVENDYTDKSYDIARHFNDKTILREKLIPEELSRSMPQIKTA